MAFGGGGDGGGNQMDARNDTAYVYPIVFRYVWARMMP